MLLFSSEPIKIPASAFSSRTDRFLKQKRMVPKAKYPMIDTFPHGAPLGGFGAGTLARTVQGDFAVWHLFPGLHIYEALKACNFAVFQKHGRKKLAYTLNHNPAAVLPTWKTLPNKHCSHYYAQYPKSWYVYNNFPAKVTLEQFSPILPHNYKETSYPAACFRVQFENKQNSLVEVAVLLSWENMLGWLPNQEQGLTQVKFSKPVLPRTNTRLENYEHKGIVFTAKTKNQDALQGEFCIAAKEVDGTKVFFCSSFDSNGDGHEVWNSFAENGTLQDSVRKDLTAQGGAIAIKAELNPGQILTIPVVITWDLPTFNHGHNYKYYTRYFDQQGNNSFAIARELLNHLENLSGEIEQWFAKYTRPAIPAWLTGAFFNELYYLADGGSLWDAESGRFTYLECFDYLFYETLDVRYYGSYPLAMFWPEIEKRIMREFTRTVFVEDNTRIEYHASASTVDKNLLAGDQKQQFIQKDYRKRKYAVPHDLGSPLENVWTKINAYTWQNANRWKDLNSKFVLLIYRAYYYSGKKDRDFLEDSWEALLKALQYIDDNLDADADHLPENENFPDQTFDNWLMNGTSAYCGILRLASLQVAIQIADILEKKQDSKRLRLILKTAKDSLYRKIWNGNYFNFDQKKDDIMAAQLMGQWYLDQLHLPNVVPPADSHSVLDKIWQANFLKFCQGKKGVVNGRTADKYQEVSCSQGNDVWVGLNYALAAHLILLGRPKEALTILKTVVDTTYQRGFLFRTPESWDANDNFLASMYMRPGAIWAVADAF